MDSYRAAAVVDAAAELVFDFVADVANVPRYAAPVLAVHAVRSRTMQVRAQLDGSPTDGTVWRRLDRAGLRLAWGTEGPGEVRGELRVTPIGADGASTMLSVVSVRVRADTADGVPVQPVLDETVRRIKRLTEQAAMRT